MPLVVRCAHGMWGWANWLAPNEDGTNFKHVGPVKRFRSIPPISSPAFTQEFPP